MNCSVLLSFRSIYCHIVYLCFTFNSAKLRRISLLNKIVCYFPLQSSASFTNQLSYIILHLNSIQNHLIFIEHTVFIVIQMLEDSTDNHHLCFCSQIQNNHTLYYIWIPSLKIFFPECGKPNLFCSYVNNELNYKWNKF